MDMTFIASESHGRHGRHGRAQSRCQMPKKKQILDDSWIHGISWHYDYITLFSVMSLQ
jgi:hypothetical protein